MKKMLVASISTAALICAIGTVQVFASARATLMANNDLTEIERPFENGRRPGGMGIGLGGEMPDRQGDLSKELTDEEKAEVEAARLQREEKLQSFIDSLNNEQKVLYDAMTPANTEKPAEGKQPANLDESFMAEMKEKQEAFVASLTEGQKAVYDELFARRGGLRKELTEEEKAQMEAVRTQREEKVNAFIDSLSSEQKVLYDAMTPVKPESLAEGQQPVKPDENAIANMKEKRDTFIASLSETQKAAYDELFGKSGHMFGSPSGTLQ